jgi:hypothetical protein
MGHKKPKLGEFATPAQTQRWIKCLISWSKANNKTHTDISNMLGYSSRSGWYRLLQGVNKRARLALIRNSTQQLGLDSNFINGVFDFKAKFSEARNIFTDFKELYAQYLSQGNQYQASQIVRKAAMFLFETLVPKDMLLSLEFVNRKNEYETAKICCSADEINFYEITVFGGPICVMFTLSKKTGSLSMPVMEGDLDIHAVSAIKHQVSTGKKKYSSTQKSVAKFTDNAKKFTI